MQLRKQLAQWHKEKRVALAKINRQQDHLYKLLLDNQLELKENQRQRLLRKAEITSAEKQIHPLSKQNGFTFFCRTDSLNIN